MERFSSFFGSWLITETSSVEQLASVSKRSIGKNERTGPPWRARKGARGPALEHDTYHAKVRDRPRRCGVQTLRARLTPPRAPRHWRAPAPPRGPRRSPADRPRAARTAPPPP